MCDTIVATPASTAERFMLFGKNSDRQRNEAQSVEHFAREQHAAGAMVDCTYLSIPQVRETHAVTLCRPFWLWGAEMGANEHGVVIGNEGLHARSGAPRDSALTGMDLLRLALERATTAAEAVETITKLLEQFGQGGNCGHVAPAYYHNGFLVADAHEAFVLETVMREWLVERVNGTRAISNRYSIERDLHASSAGLQSLVRESISDGGAASRSYADAIADPDREHIGNARARQARSATLLRSRDGDLNAADMMSILRDHGIDAGAPSPWNEECTTKRTLCMHAGGEDRAGQTVGSMVSELRAGEAVHWVTATAAPCISIFKPIIAGTPVPPHGPKATDRFDGSAFWWRHERLHRAALRSDFGRFLELIRPQRDALEGQFRTRVRAVMAGGVASERAEVVADCWRRAVALEEAWSAGIDSSIASPETVAGSAWEKMNRLACVEWA